MDLTAGRGQTIRYKLVDSDLYRTRVFRRGTNERENGEYV